ncbi:hypothetical protein EZV62_018077 [Acer yangbiense]|uniref:Ubiquitin-like protease family profile domain-containing protein n=1 Tax=Acer yangbiense TaxID=1000413 RepID=A0A5C7HIS4_9ROSI|nr:hypothetical protein EZV62_018077 [Acer yangbiense]
MTSCFKHFSNVLTNWLFSAQIVHNLLLREITVDGAGENELFVSLGGKKARFGQREFCMVTSLRFGELSDIINTLYAGNANGIPERYWPGEEGHELKLSTVPFIIMTLLQAQVLEVFEATDDEAQKDYMVGVDFNMSEGLQFIPPVEMEMKENNESLDDLDDGNDGDDGDDGAPTRKTAVKRKAQKKKKKTSAKKQRKSIPITSLDKEDPLQSSYSTGYTPTPEDFTAGDPSTPHDQFTPGYTPTPLEDMLHPPPPRHRTRSSFQQNPTPISSRQEPRSKAVKALPNEMERIVKREVSELSQLLGVLKALVQEIEPTHGQRNKEAPLTEVIDQSLHVKEVGTSVEKELASTAMKDVASTVEKEVAPTVEKEVAGSVLVSGDMRVSYNYAAEEDRSIRVRLRSAYCKSPFLDPTRASEMKREGQKQKYEAFKRKTKLVRRNVGTEESVDQSFFLELEQPKNWLFTDHIDAYMSLLAKRRESESENFRHSLVLLSSEFYLLIPCCVGEPDGHWILCKVDLLDRHISICDPTGAKKKSNYGAKYHEKVFSMLADNLFRNRSTIAVVEYLFAMG